MINIPSPSIVGHETQRRYLKRLADSGRFPQALILYGKAGIGKSLVVQELIAYMFCSASQRPCGECKQCRTVAAKTHPDLIEIAPDAKGSIKIGEAGEQGTVRWLVARLGQKAIYGRYAVIVNGFDAIQENGQNALLKTLEETAAGTMIFLITGSLSSVLPTIKSRSMMLQFSPLNLQQMALIRKPLHTLASLLSGGSLAMYDHFMQEDALAPFLEALAGIKAFFEEHKKIDIDFKALSATFAEGITMAIDAMSGFYEYNLSSLFMRKGESDVETERFMLLNSEDVRTVLRALLKLRGDQVYHVNSTQAFPYHLRVSR